jgi:putative ABC transport system permease protein
MNLFQLVIKNMRQRALSTWLTLLSVTLGVGLAIAIMVMGRETDALFGQKNFGYDILVGKKGSGLQLTINTIYHMDVSPGNIPFEVYGRFLKDGPLYPYAKLAIPTVVGDTYQGKYRIVGTLPSLFGVANDGSGTALPPDQVMEYKPDQRYEIDQGKVFAPNKFEAIIGSDLARITDLKIGTIFQATHGMPQPGETPDIHAEKWTVVGILKPTRTSADRVVWIPLTSFYTIAEHGVGLVAQSQIRAGDLPTATPDVEETVTTDPDGTEHHNNYDLTPDKVIHLHPILLDKLALSAIMVQSRGGADMQRLLYYLNNGTDVMACNPASVMRDFFDIFLKPMKMMLLLICSLVTVVAAVGILVSIYNSVSARTREIAILRALGATRDRILAIICAEAGFVALLGAVFGLAAGHGISGIGSWYMYQRFGESLDWVLVDKYEPAYLAGVIILALVAGLVPALKAYSTPVATNLVAV